MDPLLMAALADKLPLVLGAGAAMAVLEALRPSLSALRRRFWVRSEGMDPGVYNRLRGRSLRTRVLWRRSQRGKK